MDILKRIFMISTLVGLLSGGLMASGLARSSQYGGIALGGLMPHDGITQKTFGSDFWAMGSYGIIPAVGHPWDFRVRLGYYSALSHNSLDIGRDTRLTVVPLLFDVIYHVPFGIGSAYVGAGAGPYFYAINENWYGTMGTGANWGVHLLAGVEIPVNDMISVVAEASNEWVGKMLVGNSFDNTTLSLGIKLNFPDPAPASSSSASSSTNGNDSPPAQSDSTSPDDISTLKKEIADMTAKRDGFEQEVAAFFDADLSVTETGLFTALESGTSITGNTITLVLPETAPIIGKITNVTTSSTRTTVQVLAGDGWGTTIGITKSPFEFSIGNRSYATISSANIDRWVQVVTATGAIRGLSAVLADGTNLTGLQMIITIPSGSFISGVASGVSTTTTGYVVTLTRPNATTVPLTIVRDPWSVRVGTQPLPLVTRENIDQVARFTREKTNAEFAAGYRTVLVKQQYIKDLNQKIADAKAKLAEMTKASTPPPPPPPTQSNTTIIWGAPRNSFSYGAVQVIEPRPVYHPRPRYYYPEAYVVPVITPSKPPTKEEVDDYTAAKNARIQSLQNRQ